MKQVLIAGILNSLNTTLTEYNVISGEGGNWGGTVGDKEKVLYIISTPGTLRNLRVELDGVPGTGTYTFTLHRAVGIGGFANTALTCTIAFDGTQASDTANNVSVAAGDVVCLECNPNSPDNARNAKWTIEFEGDNANESLLISNGEINKDSNRYISVMGVRSRSTEALTQSICPTSGTIKNLFVQLGLLDPGTSPDAYKFTLRIGGVSQSLTVTITANDRTGNNIANDIAVSAGDVLSIIMEPLNTPSQNFIWAAVGMTFVADIDGESLILGAQSNVLPDTGTQYTHLSSKSYPGWNPTESYTYALAQVCTLKKLYMVLDGSPGSGKKYTFTVRKNASSPAGGLAVEIAAAATTGNDTSNTVTVVEDDELDLMVVPDGTPTVRKVAWGLVSYIAPLVTFIPTVTII